MDSKIDKIAVAGSSWSSLDQRGMRQCLQPNCSDVCQLAMLGEGQPLIRRIRAAQQEGAIGLGRDG